MSSNAALHLAQSLGISTRVTVRKTDLHRVEVEAPKKVTRLLFLIGWLTRCALFREERPLKIDYASFLVWLNRCDVTNWELGQKSYDGKRWYQKSVISDSSAITCYLQTN